MRKGKFLRRKYAMCFSDVSISPYPRVFGLGLNSNPHDDHYGRIMLYWFPPTLPDLPLGIFVGPFIRFSPVQPGDLNIRSLAHRDEDDLPRWLSNSLRPGMAYSEHFIIYKNPQVLKGNPLP
jgi:hypothetical protein